MNLKLTLDYSLSPGWLAPYIDGLRSGLAVASKCSHCGRVSLPPERICECGSPATKFLTLSGEATVETRATGSDGDFALVQFDGADTLSVVRLTDWTGGRRGTIQPSCGERPALMLGPREGARP